MRSGCRERRPAAPNALFRRRTGRSCWLSWIARGSPARPRGRSGPCSSTRASTWPRSLRCTGCSAGAGQVRERRARRAAHPARTKPELIAAGPNQVWSWGHYQGWRARWRGVYYHLYVMLGIFSRCAVHFEVHATELGELAKRLHERGGPPQQRRRPACHPRGPGHLDDVQDRVGPWRSSSRIPGRRSAMTTRTAKRSSKHLSYCPAFPRHVSGPCRTAPRRFCGVFFTYYNHEHRHSGIGLHTPYSVHTGTAAAIQEQAARPC